MIARLLRSPEAVAGFGLLGLLLVMALAAPLIFPRDPLSIAGPPLLHPFEDWTLPLGTDRLGRNVLAQLFHGAATSLAVGLASALAAIAVGLAVGTVAGFAGGWVDEALMRVTDAFQTVPGFLLALAFVSVVGASLGVVVLAIALAAWTGPARVARAEVLSIRERDYVASARVIGMHPAQIAFREVLPNALPPVLALTSVIVAGAILTEAALSFLGLGDPNRVTWGGMIAEGRVVLRSAPYLSVIPGIALVLTVLGVYLAGEGIVEFLCRKAKPRMIPRIAISDLSVSYGAESALRRVSLEIGAGERLAVIGESGSGKTTLGLAIADLLPPAAALSGRIDWPGFNRMPVGGRDIGMVFQDPSASLDPVLTIGEQIAEVVHAHTRSGWKDSFAYAHLLLKRVQLDPARLLEAYPHQLSGGQKQRVAIACAIAASPALLIADEATSALDTIVQAEIMELIDRLVSEDRMSLLFISHDIALASQIADRIAVFRNGELIEIGETARIVGGPAHPYTQSLLEAHIGLDADSPLPGFAARGALP